MSLLRRLLAGPAVPAPPPKPEPPTVEQLLQRLLVGTQAQKPTPAVATGSSDIETLAMVVCFSCGKAGHSATRCPDLNETFPFMLLVWKAEKVGGGYVMISPVWQQNVTGRETTTDPGRGGQPPGSVVELDPRTRGAVRCRLWPPGM